MSNNPQNAFITSVAILLVIVTLYFTTNALKRNYEISQLKLEEEIRHREQERQQQEVIREQLAEKELRRQADISARLKEHQYYCFDLQIFVAEFRDEEHLKQLTIDQSNQTTTTQQSKKTSRKKDLNKTQLTKKNNSTEPIIYLFVLVLLYLLLRAASDITQHYKEQTKGDKRNTRRCSLQVYAQMKNDRRSSRVTAHNTLSKRTENRLLTMNSRSKSVDRPILQRSKRIYPKLRSYTSVDERPSCSTSTTVIEEIPAQNTIPMNLVLPNSRPTSLIISESPSSRRCSVPAVSLQQLGVLNRRRTSIGNLAEDALSLDTKKRHRMIQRH